MKPIEFGIIDEEVPDDPNSRQWASELRWLIIVMDNDDDAFPFIAGCFAHCLRYDGLTPKQAKACQKILTRVREEHQAGVLDCQHRANPFENEDQEQNAWLSHVKTEGSA